LGVALSLNRCCRSSRLVFASHSCCRPPSEYPRKIRGRAHAEALVTAVVSLPCYRIAFPIFSSFSLHLAVPYRKPPPTSREICPLTFLKREINVSLYLFLWFVTYVQLFFGLPRFFKIILANSSNSLLLQFCICRLDFISISYLSST